MGINYIEEIIENYISEKVNESIREDFIDAAVHFNISSSICTKLDIMRIEYRFKHIKDLSVYKTFKLYSVYSYILYRAVEVETIKGTDRLAVSQSVLNMSSLITGYATMKYDNKDIVDGFKKEAINMGISNEFDSKMKNILLLNETI